jgi:glucose-1-phosphate thymidylyltransferase
MKALVLAGGTGSRLRPISDTMPKQLIPLANRPVLDYALETVRDLGITEIGIIVGDWAAAIIDAMGDGSRFGARFTYIHQDAPRGLAHCVLLARPFLGEDDFLLYLGDNILADGLADAAGQFRRHRPAAQIVVQKVANPRAFGVAELDADSTVTRLVEKPSQPRSDLAALGAYFFAPAVHEAVAAIGPSGRGELEITDAIQWMVDHGLDVRATVYEGYWQDVGCISDVLEGNRRLLGGLRPRVAGEVDEHSELIGPVIVEPGASVLRSRIEGPTIIGADARVEDSRIGSHTSIGPGSLVRYASVEDSIVQAGTAVTDVSDVSASLLSPERPPIEIGAP